MKKLLLLTLLAALCHSAYAARIVRGPYIEDPTQTTMILRWQTDEATPAWLEYGPAPRCNQIMTLTPRGTEHKAVLYGLVPNQSFCYRVYVNNSSGDGVQGAVEGEFKTLYSPERKVVSFLAIGNTGGENMAVKHQLADQMKQHKTDFLLHTGDLTSTGLDQTADAEFFTPFQSVLSKNPLFVALGANEYGPDRASKESKSFLRANYSRFHNMSWGPATPKYYSFDTANARFVFLDTNAAKEAVWAPEIGPDSAQVKWLKTTLGSAPDGAWRIVVMNAPAYSTGPNGANNEVYANLVGIFETYRVNLVLQGGDAAYERTFPMLKGEPNTRGVTYVMLGGGGPAPVKRAGSDKSTARFVAANHYAEGKIVDRKLTLKVYNEAGKQIDNVDLYL